MSDRKKNRIHILLAEDNPGDIFLVRQSLERKSIEFELHVVEDGEQAIRFIETADVADDVPCPDFLILDFHLPRRNGLEIIERMKKSQKCAQTRIVVVSSLDSPADVAEATRLGADRFFRKPASLAEFLKIGDMIIELLA